MLEGQIERNKKRKMYRNNRRSQLRYRKPRFDNRKIPKGWLAPSIGHKFDSHIKFIEHLKSVFPITEVTIEVATFDIQKIKNPDISETEYQNGEQKDGILHSLIDTFSQHSLIFWESSQKSVNYF